jgi:hypothetical protein
MKLWPPPPWRWWVTPSGGPYPDAGVIRWLRDAPLPAHLAGGLAGAGLGALGLPWWAQGLAYCLVWQAAKWDDGVYGSAWPREVLWRVLIGAAAIGALVGIVALL